MKSECFEELRELFERSNSVVPLSTAYNTLYL